MQSGERKSIDSGEWIAADAGVVAGKRFEVRALPIDQVSARSTVLAVRRLIAAARELHAHREAEKERASLWPVERDPDTTGGVILSAVMRELYEMVDRLARADIPVLVTGETGVGKELVSRELHRRGRSPAAPFVAYNCTAVPRDMLDAQLFGHKRGAFTGAHENFSGVIRAAAGGTLLLDEIGELSLDIQPKLLRFLENGEIHPIGEARPLKVDVRIVAATNADLDHMVREGRFREDLLYRLNVVTLHVPPLRERREEIPAMADHFLDRYAQDMRKARLRMSDEALEYLVLYRWPGNVRQLANEIRRVVALAPGGTELVPTMLSEDIRASRRTIDASRPVVGPDEMVVRVDQPLADAVAQLEWTMIERALARGGGRLEDAAHALGISRKGLFLKRKRLGLMRRPERATTSAGL